MYIYILYIWWIGNNRDGTLSVFFTSCIYIYIYIYNDLITLYAFFFENVNQKI